ncbi:LysM peptidoglycan-binding domain-containing protein [Actimicrobium antarcticum]|uniref:LysM peptidoglycan-binding domain-containing protein n=1 Tax=Actimicrobium antarcticum TaxID=1051899 RepID=A0ABP7T436_9BURK
MKKFSTAALCLAFATAAFSLTVSSHAQAASARCEFLANAPDSHLVVRGDTLWDISGKFLQHPWCWPQVWDMNRDQIRNPHWIYPGQTVYFDRINRRLRLGSPSGSPGDTPTIRVSPGMRIQGLGNAAIPAIPSNVIEPFLSQPLIIEENELQGTPRIVAAQEGHVFLGKNDKAYVRGDLKDDTAFQVFRPGLPLKDPETKQIIGYEAVYLGNVKLVQADKSGGASAHVFNVVSTKQEMGVGDRLLPVPPTPILNYVPHPPEQPVDARIVSIYGGVTHAGQNQLVTINRGKRDGIDIGTVLQLSRFGETIIDKTDGKKEKIKLPDTEYGTVFVFRVFNGISYALVMQVSDSVQIGDVAKSPE